MEKESIIDMITKLWALASNNPNEHEAERAAIRAQELMLKYNIEKYDLGEKDRVEYVEETFCSFKHQTADKHAVAILMNEYLVKPIFINQNHNGKSDTVLIIFGERENLRIAKYVGERFLEIGNQLWEKYRKIQGLSRKYRGDYFFGLSRGYVTKLREQKDSLKHSYGALVPIESALDNAFKNNWQKTEQTTVKTHDMDVYAQGFLDGKKLNLNQALNAASKPQLSHTVR